MNVGPILRAMRHNRTRVGLIVLEIAITLAIVTNCVNVILAERAKMSRVSGFDDDNIVRMHTRPFTQEFREDAFLGTIIANDLRTIAAVPGVRAVANTGFQLWEGGGSSTAVKPLGVIREPVITQTYYGTKDLMEALGVRIVEGRGFQDSDYGRTGAPRPPRVAIVTKALADELFPQGDALGKSIQQASDAQHPLDDGKTIVGVIETAYNPWGIGAGRGDTLGERIMFEPAGSASYERGISYLIRTEPGAMSSVAAEVERKLTQANAGRVFDFKSTGEKKGTHFASSKIAVTTMTCIVVALVAVTALGLLGLTSLAVAERTKQIGVRRALGATRGQIVGHFLIENWLVTTAGLLLGIVSAYGLNFVLVTRVSDVKLHWQLVAAGMLLLWANGIIATLPAALRASFVPPSTATRTM
jgi:putative ABC transport system permease protein